MSTPRKDEAGLESTGHLSEGALALAADGRLDLVSSDAASHLEACEDCATRLADQALASDVVQRNLEALASAPELVKEEGSASRPSLGRVPRGAIAVALVCVALASLPAIPALLRGLAQAPGSGRVLVLALASATRAAALFVSRQDVAIASAAFFVLIGTVIAVRASRAEEKKHAVV